MNKLPIKLHHKHVRRMIHKHAASIMIIGLSFLLLLFVRFQVNHQITGDEPHYLLMSHSLIYDHDLNLKNNFASKDFLRFYPADLPPFNQIAQHQLETNADKFYSIHGAALSVILAPGYYLGGWEGAATLMVFLAAIVVWLTWIWTLLITKNRLASYIAVGLMVASAFFSNLAGYLYPDILIAGCTLIALITLYKYPDRKSYQILFGAVISVMVFAHFKTAALALPLACVFLYKEGYLKRKIPWLLIIVTSILGVGFLYTLQVWYGVWNPSEIYGSRVNLSTSPLQTIPAMLFDANRGLLIYNPAFLLIFLGLIPWYKQHKETFMVSCLILIPTIYLLATFNIWDGGYAPIGRYIISFLPVFIPAVAFSIILFRNFWQKSFLTILAAMTIVMTTTTLIIQPSYIDTSIYRTRPQIFSKIEQKTNLDFELLLPNYSNITTLDSSKDRLKVIIYSLLLCSIVYYGNSLSKKPTKRRAKP